MTALKLVDSAMPDWVRSVLTERQVNKSNAVWRWKRLLYAAELPGIPKALGACVADHCRDDQPYCWASLETLALESGFSRGALMKATRRRKPDDPLGLEDVGLLVVERERNPVTKRQKNNVYHLAWPAKPIATHTTRIHDVNPATADLGAPEEPPRSPGELGSVHHVNPEPGAPRVLEVSISKASNEVSKQYAAFRRAESSDPIIGRCVEIFEPLGVDRDDCVRAVSRLRCEDIGDLVLDQALGQCERVDRLDGLGYFVTVARDFFRQRTGSVS